MKINKVSDLSSISVLPPHTRKSNTGPSGLQGPQLRSQPSGHSQQSFSHGLSSQNALLSQFSQNSLDEAVTNDQRLGSQERENSVKRLSCFPALTYGREESQPPNSRSSANLMRKWNSVELKSQLSEGLEHRIGIMETSLSRFAMILDSIQNDVMQVNKGTKEVTLEMEHMRQKLIAQDSTLQLMTKGQEEIKTSIDGSLKSLSDQVSKVTSQDKLQETFLVVSTLPQLIEASLQNLQKELQNNFSKEMQVVSCSLKSLNRKDLAPATISNKSIGNPVTIPKKLQVPVSGVKINVQATRAPEVGNEGWKSVKKVAFSDRLSDKEHKQKGPCLEKHDRGERDCKIIIESDEETDGSFSCLSEKCTDLYGKWTKEAKEESERILREARRRKRKHCNTIIIN
ncbi:protein PAIR1-like [Neltuma alba]|uniref:protein PAIR1 n=1 Tax=Neltuma alba TaxID=207710 RepID=UPI0010A5064A|nr:protein PAIR1 [Prosopis alba]XP_028770305.1 protein PAIR1 [Prosopis alba]XP_028785544.1 protein PAIR1-like [Prosopis alba]XP_028785545.1 protein PAIR1-like [Prosopis alba]